MFPFVHVRHFTLPALVFAAIVWLCLCTASGGQAQDQSAKVLAASTPADRVKLASGEWFNIEPLGPDTLLDPEFPGNIVTTTTAEADQPAQPLMLTRPGVAEYLPYERQVLQQVTEFQKAAGDLPALERLAAVESVLAETLRFHLQVRESPLHGHNRWQPLRVELDRALLAARRESFRERTASVRDAKEWERALHQGDELVAWYPGDMAVLTDVARLRLRHAAFVMHNGNAKAAARNFAEIRKQLHWVEEHLSQAPPPHPLHSMGDSLLKTAIILQQPDVATLQSILVGKAAGLLAEARQIKDDRAALKLLEAAQEVWPRLPGLRDELLKRQGKYTILNVGVRLLPTHFSPARAVTDSELQALELLFEGLVHTRLAADGNLITVPQLAATITAGHGGQRQIALRKTAYWSNGSRVTAADVRKTFDLLTNPKLPDRNGELADQLEPFRTGDDPFRVESKLRQGLLDPLAPFTFKILPREYAGAPLTAADNEAFAIAPVGSGPYMLAGRGSEHGRSYVRFVVNPHYRGAGGNGPAIRELRFFVCQNPVADFADKTAPMHLLLDAPTQLLPKLKAAGSADVRTLPTRRIYFLAVNHRDPLLAEPALRRALAHALDRQQLLADCFISGPSAAPQAKGATYHHPLNGPYPADSWACSTDKAILPSLLDRAKAAALLKGIKGEIPELELKYPDDDPAVAQACQAIAAEWADFGTRAGRPLKMKLVPLPVRELHRDLLNRNYQLAYWHHDFADDHYSLWPLFDPSETALATGSNYLGCKDDGIFPAILEKAASHRDFAEVKRLTHEIHAAFIERMPFIPLWQLDYHIAVHPNLKMPAVDPLRVFANVEEWQVAGR